MFARIFASLVLAFALIPVASGDAYKASHTFDSVVPAGRRYRRHRPFHAGPMASGQLVHSELRVDSEWLPANRARPGETLWKAACKK